MPAPDSRLAGLAFQPAVRALRQAAAPDPVHLVGGVLRDRLLGRRCRDLDAVVAGRGEEIAADLARRLGARLVRLGGERFAAFRLVAGALTVDLWDRGQTTLEEDLARRDFTINAFAWDLAGGRLEDPWGGLADLGDRRLRAVSEGSFAADPLRVLRLARLAAQLPGFAADPATVELARAAAPRLGEVAAERVREELLLTFAAPGAALGLALLAELRLYPGLWLGRPGEELPAGRTPALFAALEEEVPALRRLRRGSQRRLDLQAARLALTFLGLSPGGEPEEALARCREAGYLTAREAKTLAVLMAWARPPRGEVARRRFLHGAGRDLWLTAAAVVSAVARSAGDERWLAGERPALFTLARGEGAALFAPPRLLSGDEVQALLGVSPGPAVGRALARLLAAQVDGRVRTRDEAVRLLES
jgi:Poly A polymerase head domain/Probable RNA and SrmB- binding site of polymerase A